jgi:hypothetical protein
MTVTFSPVKLRHTLAIYSVHTQHTYGKKCRLVQFIKVIPKNPSHFSYHIKNTLVLCSLLTAHRIHYTTNIITRYIGNTILAPQTIPAT